MRWLGRGAALLLAAVATVALGVSAVADSHDWDIEDGREGDRCSGCGRFAGGPYAPGQPGYRSDMRRRGGDSFGECWNCGPGGTRPGDGAPGTTGGTPGGSPAATGTGTGGGGGATAPAAPPAPPTLGEALASCPSPPPPQLGRNPDPEGVTGLATHLWAQPQEPMSSATTIRGYPVACTLTPTQWTWESGDGASYTRDRPGGPHPDHPAEHVYESKGDYDQRLTVRWQATTSAGAGTLTRSTTVPYHVFEIRSVLTG